jgi:predicted DNA-binding antitoxin AbrB/MazE fold protein
MPDENLHFENARFAPPFFAGLPKIIFRWIMKLVMTTTVEAIYEHGKLLLSKPLSLPEKTHVRVTIESDTERETWLKLSEEALIKTWDNDADDVFNELLKK